MARWACLHKVFKINWLCRLQLNCILWDFLKNLIIFLFYFLSFGWVPWNGCLLSIFTISYVGGNWCIFMASQGRWDTTLCRCWKHWVLPHICNKDLIWFLKMHLIVNSWGMCITVVWFHSICLWHGGLWVEKAMKGN